MSFSPSFAIVVRRHNLDVVGWRGHTRDRADGLLADPMSNLSHYLENHGASKVKPLRVLRGGQGSVTYNVRSKGWTREHMRQQTGEELLTKNAPSHAALGFCFGFPAIQSFYDR